MSATQDARLMDLFTLVVGILVGIAITLAFLVTALGGRTLAAQVRDGEYQRQVVDRIAPVGRIAVSGRDNSTLEPLTVAAVTAPAVSTAVLTGEEVYQMACVACHGSGIAGAPRFGDKAAWAPRLAKGIEVLHQSALQGTQSASGVMPAKGGRADLSAQSIANGVDYMIGAARHQDSI